MNEKTIRALIEAGAVKRSRIVARGGRFHVEFDTLTASVTASTHRTGVKQWATLDAAARWVHGLGIGTAQLELSQWSPRQRALDL